MMGYWIQNMTQISINRIIIGPQWWIQDFLLWVSIRVACWPLMWILFGKNMGENKRIGSSWGLVVSLHPPLELRTFIFYSHYSPSTHSKRLKGFSETFQKIIEQIFVIYCRCLENTLDMGSHCLDRQWVIGFGIGIAVLLIVIFTVITVIVYFRARRRR